LTDDKKDELRGMINPLRKAKGGADKVEDLLQKQYDVEQSLEANYLKNKEDADT